MHHVYVTTTHNSAIQGPGGHDMEPSRRVRMDLSAGTSAFGKSRSDRYGGAGPHEVVAKRGKARNAGTSSGATSTNTMKTSTSTYELFGSQQSVEVPVGPFEGARRPDDASNR